LFLRHIERTEILLFLIDSQSEDYQKDFSILLKELKTHSKILAQKKKLISISKSDLLTETEIVKLKKKKFRGADSPTIVFSSATRNGIQELLDYLWKELTLIQKEVQE